MDLAALRVLDLTRLLPGPYATQLLADMGADVIKIEPPGGDYARLLDDLDGGGMFAAVNRGKRSVELDLKTDAGVEAVRRLAADADVVVEQFRPGVVDRLGVGYEDLAKVNPDLVYCSLSGFGQTGPYRDRVGHDLNYVGMAGMLALTRADPDGRPAIPGFPIADMAGGAFATLAITSALVSRELGNGGGEHLDVSMTDAVLSFSQVLAGQAIAGEEQQARATALTGKYPCYDVYATADERYVTLAALEPKFWRAFCDAIDRPDLVAVHLSNDPATREALRETLRDVFSSRTRDEWEAMLGSVDAMVAPVLSLREAVMSEHANARELVVGDPPRVRAPIQSSAGVSGTEDDVPTLGADTEAVLADAGFDADEIQRFVE